MLHARDIMRAPVISVSPTTSLPEVARTLVDNSISGCPVIDANGMLRGVISRTNILEHVLTEGGMPAPALRSLVPGIVMTGEDEGEDYEPNEEAEAQDAMAGDVEFVGPGATLADVAAVMSRERIHRVPVVDGTRVVGIITSLDLLEVMARGEGKAASAGNRRA